MGKSQMKIKPSIPDNYSFKLSSMDVDVPFLKKGTCRSIVFNHLDCSTRHHPHHHDGIMIIIIMIEIIILISIEF